MFEPPSRSCWTAAGPENRKSGYESIAGPEASDALYETVLKLAITCLAVSPIEIQG